MAARSPARSGRWRTHSRSRSTSHGERLGGGGPQAVEVAAGRVEAGTVGAQRLLVTGSRDGRPVLSFRANWYLTTDVDPRWDLRETGWHVLVQGDTPLDIGIRFPVDPDEWAATLPGLTAHRPVNAVAASARPNPGSGRRRICPRSSRRCGDARRHEHRRGSSSATRRPGRRTRAVAEAVATAAADAGGLAGAERVVVDLADLGPAALRLVLGPGPRCGRGGFAPRHSPSWRRRRTRPATPGCSSRSSTGSAPLTSSASRSSRSWSGQACSTHWPSRSTSDRCWSNWGRRSPTRGLYVSEDQLDGARRRRRRDGCARPGRPYGPRRRATSDHRARALLMAVRPRRRDNAALRP